MDEQTPFDKKYHTDAENCAGKNKLFNQKLRAWLRVWCLLNALHLYMCF